MTLFCRSCLITILLATCTLAQDLDPRLCSAIGDPVTEAPFNLVDAFCIPSSVALGNAGEPASIAGSGTFKTNANGQLDVFILWEPGQIATVEGESFQYSSSLSWNGSKPDAVYKEWVGNFVPEQPYAFLITDSSNPELTPTELTLADDSGHVTERVFPHAAFPDRPLGRYHIQITGLDAFQDVEFSKTAAGGHVSVVPEPASALSILIGLICAAAARTSRHRP